MQPINTHCQSGRVGRPGPPSPSQGSGRSPSAHKLPLSNGRSEIARSPVVSHCTVTLFLLAVSFFLLPDLPASSQPLDPLGFLQTHCITCHGEEKQKGDRRFDQLTLDFQNLDTAWDWEEILDLLNLGEMPPEDEPQPTTEERLAMVDWITGKLETGPACAA